MSFWSSFLIARVFFLLHNVQADGKVSCFYNSSAQYRNVLLQVTYEHLRPAIPYCTHLVYGFFGIHHRTHKVRLLNPWMSSESELKKFRLRNELMDSKTGSKNLQKTVELRHHNPSIKMLLSVGGNLDPRPQPYFKVLETNESRAIFIKSLVSTVEENGFDGADLAWQFPIHEENETKSICDTSVGFVKEHKTMFRYLVEELSTELTRRKRLLTFTALPHIKADEFIDFDTIKNCVEHIHLMTYDYKTPWRTPNEADYAAPLYYVRNRNENRNVEQTVKWWLKQNVPAEKLLIAIPTFGRGWKINEKSGWKMKPPVKANGFGENRLRHISDRGTFPYYELCNLLITRGIKNQTKKLRKVTDTKHHFGSYAYRRGDGDFDMWVSFEEPKTAAEKANFANRMHLGGVAIVDLSLDDYSGRCKGNRSGEFPILRKAKFPEGKKARSYFPVKTFS